MSAIRFIVKSLFAKVSREPFKWRTKPSPPYEHLCKQTIRQRSTDSSYPQVPIFYAALPTFLAFFRKKEEDGTVTSFLESILPEELIILWKYRPEPTDLPPEERLKIMMRRTILCIKRGQFIKADQMAHLALRMAQDLQHYDGITFAVDIMANLADSLNQYQKAEKLYIEVTKRLVMKGVPLDDASVIHLSVKLGYLAEQQGNEPEAVNNYAWAVKQLEHKIKAEPDNADVMELWGLANNYYGKLLLRQGYHGEAKNRLRIAYDMYVKYRDKLDIEFVDIANNLAVACSETNDLETAVKLINETLTSASMHPGMLECGIYQANKGMILLKKGLTKQAASQCEEAQKLANQSQNPSGQQQASYCLEQIEKALARKEELIST